MTLLLLNYLGTIVFAITGAYAAARKGMDIIGVIMLACVVGNGGGTMRDLFLGLPAFWVIQHGYLWASIIAALGALLLARFFSTPDRTILVGDALGLGVFVVTGAAKTLALGYAPSIAVLMGILTGAGGGILRDMLCNEIPLFMRREIYISAALLGGIIYILLLRIPTLSSIAAPASIVCTFSIRLAAMYYNWNLPAFKPEWFKRPF